MRSQLRPLILSTTSAVLILVGCSSTSDTTVAQPTTTVAAEAATTTAAPTTTTTSAPASTEESASAPTVDGFDVEAIVARIGDGYIRLGDRWPGFDPNEHPTVLPLKDAGGSLQGVLTLNFPTPEALGVVTEIDTAGTGVTTAHLITDPVEFERLESFSVFDFHFRIADVDSFAMEAGGTDAFFDPTSNEYVATLLHEMFHRWQDESFSGDIGLQDVEGYAYTPENIEMAALEDRALLSALGTDDPAERETAVRRFAALRLARLAADGRVVLDNDQERYEGTARWIEHVTAGDDTTYATFSEQDFSAELFPDPTETFGGVKEHYGFGRFYSSSAAMVHLLELLDASDIGATIEAGAAPAESIIEHLGLTDASQTEIDALVAEVRAEYDPLSELPDLSAIAAERVVDEPPIFGDLPDGEFEDDGTFEGDDGDFDGEEIVITDEEIACFAERGVDLFSDAEPSQEDFDACLAPLN